MESTVISLPLESSYCSHVFVPCSTARQIGCTASRSNEEASISGESLLVKAQDMYVIVGVGTLDEVGQGAGVSTVVFSCGGSNSTDTLLVCGEKVQKAIDAKIHYKQ